MQLVVTLALSTAAFHISVFLVARIKGEGDWAVVDDGDGHHGPKHTICKAVENNLWALQGAGCSPRAWQWQRSMRIVPFTLAGSYAARTFSKNVW